MEDKGQHYTVFRGKGLFLQLHYIRLLSKMPHVTETLGLNINYLIINPKVKNFASSSIAM